MKVIILTAFNSYTPKDILFMTEKEFIYNFVCAENKLSKTVTLYLLSNSSSVKVDPKYPAPPVIKTFFFI